MSEREQVWRERIEWQPWSGLTVAECCEDAAQIAAALEKAARRRKKRADRKLCLDALPQIEHHHDVSPEEKVCGECQRDKTCIGEEISRVLDFVPGQLEVHNHHLKKYACTCGQCGVTTAPVPLKPIEKCIAGPCCCCRSRHLSPPRS
jgi:transposase